MIPHNNTASFVFLRKEEKNNQRLARNLGRNGVKSYHVNPLVQAATGIVRSAVGCVNKGVMGKKINTKKVN